MGKGQRSWQEMGPGTARLERDLNGRESRMGMRVYTRQGIVLGSVSDW